MQFAYVAVTLTLATASIATAQTGDPNSNPGRGTAQRTAIMNAARPAAEAEFGRPVEFVVSCVQVERGWAVLMATPQRPGGRAIPAPRSDFRDGNTVTAVLRFQNGRWRLMDHRIGATDMWWDGMVPRSLAQRPCN
jgi:hypothetical protein